MACAFELGYSMLREIQMNISEVTIFKATDIVIRQSNRSMSLVRGLSESRYAICHVCFSSPSTNWSQL